MLRNQTLADPPRMAAALAGLRAYQHAPRSYLPLPAPILDREGRVVLRSYGAEGPQILFVPSLINGSAVLDLTAQNSMMRGLAAQGMNPLLLDWGTPRPDEADLDIAGHVERYLVPLLRRRGEIALAGYCLGGTMAIAAAAACPVRALILIATPWDFAGFPDSARDDLRGLWEKARPVCELLGLVPAETLQHAFWQLDPARTIEKFVHFAGKDPDSPEGQNYVAVEDWANDGPPMTFAAGRELMEALHGANMTGTGRWSIAGRIVDPASFAMPLLNILSTTDRITPAATAWSGGEIVALDEGHVGMVVGRRAPGSLWAIIADWMNRLPAR